LSRTRAEFTGARPPGLQNEHVWLAGSILLAVFVLPGAWDVPVVTAGAAVEALEGVLWFRWSRRHRAAVGAEALIGETAVVAERCDPIGRVKVKGELWRARTTGANAVEAGETVRVLAVEDLTVLVEPD
jgi:membrane protein implicated in regulation of membrane protease activity